MATLYINSYYTSVYSKKRKIEIRVLNKESGKQDIHYVPYDDVDKLVITGNPTVSTSVISKLLRQNVPVHFLSSSGAWRGTLSGEKNGNAFRRIQQVHSYEDKNKRLIFTRLILSVKFKNSRRVLQRLAANRKMSSDHKVKYALFKLKEAADDLNSYTHLDELRGLEGFVAVEYFKGLTMFFPDEFPFEKRSRRPPLNEANAMLSWSYTIVQSEIEAAVRMHNLDPYIGFLHDPSYNTPSLALDILEVFRAPVCDMLTLKLFNHKIIRAEHFEKGRDQAGIFLNEKGRKLFFGQYERHMTRSFSTQPSGEHTNFRELIDQAVINTCKFIDGDKSSINFFSAP